MKKNKTHKSIQWILVLVMTSVFYTNCGQNGFQVDPSGSTDLSSTGTDPLYGYAWHLHNTGQSVFAPSPGVAGNDLNLQQTWADGIFGNGVRVQVSDDGVQDTHEDLNANFLYSSVSKDYTQPPPYLVTKSPPRAFDDDHGTAVAGLIGAVAGNGLGSRGVAPRVKLTSANILSANVARTDAMIIDQADGDFDISNMSWGVQQNTIFESDPGYDAMLLSAVTNKRSNRGAIYVKSSGNNRIIFCRGSQSVACLGNSNFDPYSVNPYTIVVGALNAGGTLATYSSPGANVWISGMGGEFGDDTPAMITTDRTSCNAGYARSNSSSVLAFEKGQNGNPICNYTSIFNGTSSAAPVVSGAIALMLEAKPTLTWRDVKFILAKTATKIDATSVNINHPLNGLPGGYIWEPGWITNAATFNFHNRYGFGRVNVDAAVAMAKIYSSTLGAFTSTGWLTNGTDFAIPDNAAGGNTSSISVATNLKVEAVQIRISVTHPNISELAVELVSPSTTKSVIINMKNSLTGLADFEGETFLSNAFFQESSLGNWTIRLVDGVDQNAGTLTSWSINISGAP